MKNLCLAGFSCGRLAVRKSDSLFLSCYLFMLPCLAADKVKNVGVGATSNRLLRIEDFVCECSDGDLSTLGEWAHP